MGQRLQLQSLLETILGSRNVYFQAPPNTGMEYPCIIYSRDYVYTGYADNLPYSHAKRYLITSIDRNPDSDIPDKLSNLPTARFSRHFVTENLHHDVYNIYF